MLTRSQAAAMATSAPTKATRAAQVVAFVAEYGGMPYYEEAKPGKWHCPCCDAWVIERNADRECSDCRAAHDGIPEHPPFQGVHVGGVRIRYAPSENPKLPWFADSIVFGNNRYFDLGDLARECHITFTEDDYRRVCEPLAQGAA